MSKGKNELGVGEVPALGVREGNIFSKKTTSLDTMTRFVARSKTRYSFFP
jgi:hypothetical protein